MNSSVDSILTLLLLQKLSYTHSQYTFVPKIDGNSSKGVKNIIFLRHLAEPFYLPSLLLLLLLHVCPLQRTLFVSSTPQIINDRMTRQRSRPHLRERGGQPLGLQVHPLDVGPVKNLAHGVRPQESPAHPRSVGEPEHKRRSHAVPLKRRLWWLLPKLGSLSLSPVPYG